MGKHDDDTRDTRETEGRTLSPRQGKPPTHAREHGSPKRNHAEELTATIATAQTRRGRLEPAIVGGIRQRAELYEKAFVHAKQDVIDAVARNVAASERQARQDEVLRQADVEVLPPETVGKLAALDARQYAKLRDPHHRAEAAQAMATTARLSAGYHAALAASAPEVSAAVRNAIAAREKTAEVSAAPASGDRPATPRDRAVSEVSPAPAASLDASALERVAANRARDLKMVTEQLSLNGIELIATRKHLAERLAEPNAAANPLDERPPRPRRSPTGDNQVASDEVFTATKSEGKPLLPAEVEDRYLRVGSRFYHPHNPKFVVFEDKGNTLHTRSNSEQIAETMVSIARARGWDEIKVSGSETFRREVWLDASAHGMHVKGYTPSEVDRAELAKRTKHVEANQVAAERGDRGRHHRSDVVQSSRVGAPGTSQTNEADAVGKGQPAIEDRQRAQAFAEKSVAQAILDHPELAGTYAALTSTRKKAVADGLSSQQRAVVMARVEANLVNSIERGDLPTVKIREKVETQYERKLEREVIR